MVDVDAVPSTTLTPNVDEEVRSQTALASFSPVESLAHMTVHETMTDFVPTMLTVSRNRRALPVEAKTNLSWA